jgi:class 3 adenylate cyclase
MSNEAQPRNLPDVQRDSFEEPGNATSVLSSSMSVSPTNAATASPGRYSPEALVRRENRAIRCVKLFAILVLLAAATTTAALIFQFTRGSERDRFRNEFVFISEAIARGLMEDASLYVSSAQSIATALTILIEAYNATQLSFNIPMGRYGNLTSEVVRMSYYASWNPLIRSDTERQQFEEMVKQKYEEGFFTSGSNPICYVCGDQNMAPSTPEAVVLFPGIGQYDCDDLYRAGLVGYLDATSCSAVTTRAINECSCVLSTTEQNLIENRSPSEGIFRYEPGGNLTIEDEPWTGGPYLPMFLDTLMVSGNQPVLYNHLSSPKLAHAASQMIFSGTPQMTDMISRADRTFFAESSGALKDPRTGPASILYFPVQSPQGSEILGALSLQLIWSNLLTRPVAGIGRLADIVIESSCGQKHSYKIKKDGLQLEWMGEGDFHDRQYDHMALRTSFEDFQAARLAAVNKAYSSIEDESCEFLFSVYPTKALEEQYITRSPFIFSGSAVVIFLFTTIVFVVYDYMVCRLQAKIMKSAKQTDTIVASLFPESVRDRLYMQQAADASQSPDSILTKAKSSLLSSSTNAKASVFGSAPIADFFPSCTVMFIDIANFTAWCSEREPSQVFILLENVYHEFDEIADQLGVFKVETIGDSYVAVAGLPTPRKDHAVVMTRFAYMCLSKMEQRVKELEVSLGPSTGDLRARCGLHSGPVTAGVLRGTKARFQLFGDTVNTASRMESSSAVNRIHASEQTVRFLRKANKASWVISREDRVQLKGKGTLQTFWLDPQGDKTPSIGSGCTSALSTQPDVNAVDFNSATADRHQRKQRLIEWNVEVLYELLLRVAATREAEGNTSNKKTRIISSTYPQTRKENEIVIDEMTEILCIPDFDPAVEVKVKETVALSPDVKEQLHEYVSTIAQLYRDDVPFHNFEHASHVIMSATKLMKRIMAPEGVDWDVEGVSDECERKVEIARQVHNVTYGMSSDPLMQFSVVFSALIHDVDHTGLTNKELIDINAPVAAAYRSKCVAEQNSVDVAWRVLMENRYRQLRGCIFRNRTEQNRFRELVVDAVLATDIADKELGTLRKSRWEQAFSAESTSQTPKMDMDRKATIVFEHIIQASDVCHCMQHWHTYQKFNTRLFEERYVAYRKGVAGDKPPWAGWYNGEIWFFDNYIIPLAQKLNECGVFGVSYHEYLNYAQENRLEWERKGQEIVESLRVAVESKYEGVVF